MKIHKSRCFTKRLQSRPLISICVIVFSSQTISFVWEICGVSFAIINCTSCATKLYSFLSFSSVHFALQQQKSPFHEPKDVHASLLIFEAKMCLNENNASLPTKGVSIEPNLMKNDWRFSPGLFGRSHRSIITEAILIKFLPAKQADFYPWLNT